VAQTFFIFFSGSPPTETAKYVDPSYTTSHVTFFARNHKGDNIARIIQECKNFIAGPRTTWTEGDLQAGRRADRRARRRQRGAGAQRPAS